MELYVTQQHYYSVDFGEAAKIGMKWKNLVNRKRDEALVAAVARGSDKAFQTLFERYSGAVLGYSLRFMKGNASSAEDVSQMSWEKVVRAAPTYSGEGFTAWLFTIVRNTALNELRRLGHLKEDIVEEDSAEFGSASEDVEELLIHHDEFAELEKRIDLLPDRQRIALILWMEDGLSQKDMAAQLGVSVKAFETLLIRAKRHLKEGGSK